MNIIEKMSAAVNRAIEKNRKFSEKYGNDILYAPDFENMVYVAKDPKTNKLTFRGDCTLISTYDPGKKLLAWASANSTRMDKCTKNAPDVKVLYDGTPATQCFTAPGLRQIDMDTVFCLNSYVFDYFGGEYLAVIDTGEFVYYLILDNVIEY